MVALKDGDIVFAQFKHQEGPVMAKVRPVMIVDVTPFGIEVIYGSSQQIAQALPWEFIIPENEIELVFLKRITRFDFKHRDILTPNLDDKRVWAHQERGCFLWGAPLCVTSQRICVLATRSLRRLAPLDR